MTSIGLIYGSDDGNTEVIAYRIAERLGADHVDVHDIADASPDEFEQYSTLILGTPTWDFGQRQSDWDDFWEVLADIDFSGKTVALFGLGDQFGYGDYFLDALGMLHDVIVANGADIIGQWPTDGYQYDASKAEVPGVSKFMGLGIDEDQQPELTRERLDQWVEQIHRELQLDWPLHDVDD